MGKMKSTTPNLSRTNIGDHGMFCFLWGTETIFCAGLHYWWNVSILLTAIIWILCGVISFNTAYE